MSRRLIDISRGRNIRTPLPQKKFERVLKSIYKKLAPRLQHSQIELRLVGDGEIKKLNKQFRSKDKATDVLSFEYHQDGLLGAIVISVPTAKRQARKYKHSVTREIRELFVHGVLHLLGYDHMRPRDAHQMARLENQFNRLWT